MNSFKSLTTKFFLLNPTKEKIIVSILDSLILILISLIIPSIGYLSVLLSRELSAQIFSLIGSLFFSFVVYYPFACGLVYIFRAVIGKEEFKIQDLVIALFFITIFNPITFSIIIIGVTKNDQNNLSSVASVNNAETQNELCGILITEVEAPSAKTAGLVVGEVIQAVNGYPVNTVGALTRSLADKRLNDIVMVVTNTNTYSVTLSANPKDPQQASLGIKVKILECGK